MAFCSNGAGILDPNPISYYNSPGFTKYLGREGRTMKYKAIQISPLDNVAMAVTSIPKGQTVSISNREELVVNQEIPLGHKISLMPIAKGANIIRYGEVICTASKTIKPGEWVHIHNTKVKQ